MNRIDEILFKHNIYPTNKGYRYIQHIVMNDLSIPRLHIMEVYKSIAEKFGTTASAVEHAIRTARIRSDFLRTTNKRFLAILQTEYRSGMEDEN